MSKLNIRPALAADLATLLAFEQGVVAAERPFNDTVKPGTVHYYDLAALLASDDTLVLLAEIDEVAVGTGHVTIKESLDYVLHDRHAYLGLMYVDPEYRGRGIIQKIMAELFTWAQSHGLDYFYLDVFSGNESAIKAYQNFGFRDGLVEMILHKP